MTYKSFDDLFAAAERRPTYHAAGVAIDFTVAVTREMAMQDISRAELARRIGTSPAYVTKLFGGSANFTIETMVKIADALGMTVTPHLNRKAVTEWPEALHATRRRRFEPGDGAYENGVAPTARSCEATDDALNPLAA
jgi:transcriptional regulator with XRE-family HTH domain